MLNNLITERQFLPSAAKLTNGFPCRKYYERLAKKDDGSIFDDETPKSDKNTTVKELLFAVRTIRQAKEKEVQEAEKIRQETEKELIRLEKAQDEAKVAEIKALTSEEIAERIAAAKEKLK